MAEDLIKSTSTKTFFEHRTVRSKRKAPRQWEKNEFEWWLISNLFQLLLYSTPPPCQFCLSHASALCSALPCSYSLERVWLELSGLAMITTTGARGRELWARTLICHSLNSLFSLMVSIQRIAQGRWHWLLTYSECGRPAEMMPKLFLKNNLSVTGNCKINRVTHEKTLLIIHAEVVLQGFPLREAGLSPQLRYLW